MAATAAGCGRDDELADRSATSPPAGFTTIDPRKATPSTTARTATTKAKTTKAKRTTGTTSTTARTATTKAKRTKGTASTPATSPFELSPAAARLRSTAVAYARRRFDAGALARNVTLRRSRRAPRWAIATGAKGRTLWVVWLRDGAVVLATKDVKRFNPPSVPCDLRPAFAKPSC